MNENLQMSRKCEKCGTQLGTDAPEGLCPRCLLALNLEAPTEAPGGEAGPGGTKVVPRKPELPLLEEIARHFPQLELLECIGRGGMGIVYKARQPRLNRLVALKILAREKEKDPQFAERFTREAQALARLNHANIVTIYDFGEADGLYYLLMEFADGLSLRQLLQSRKITPEEALGIVPAICEALQYAHQQGIVHRDIKPENILLDKQGRVKIADFGIAKLLHGEACIESLTGEQQVVGTPHYMAPEQVEQPGIVDHRADIYSLGVVFYEMLTGELPLGKFAPPSHRVRVDVRLDEVVLHTLEKEPARRYQQASQVKTDVETIAAGSGGAKASPSRMDAPPGGSAGVPPPMVATAPEPRLSRMAVVGAFWMPAFFIAAFLLMLVRSTEMRMEHMLTETSPNGAITVTPHFSAADSGISNAAWWQRLFAFAIAPLGITAPFGTTILGWIAFGQIRRSNGRLHGVGLAAFDAFFFPLLALDIAVGWVCYSVMQALGDWVQAMNTQATSWAATGDLLRALWFPLALVAVICVDILLVRRVWRAISKTDVPPGAGAA
jgi:serine/threonine protein kinase